MSEWIKWFSKVSGFFFALLATVAIAAYITIAVLVPAESVTVPEVVGVRIEDALFLLSEKNLSVKVVDIKFSGEVPENFVISQFPAPETKVRENRNVELVISGGAEKLIISELVGMKLREAKVHLSGRGVNSINVSYIFSEASQDVVIAQDPPAGFKMARGEGINLLVSAGVPETTLMMPDLRGIKLNEVAERFGELPVGIIMVKEEFSTLAEGVIISQSIVPGTIINRDTGVELVVSGRTEESLYKLSLRRWVLDSVQIPLGFTGKKVLVVVTDEEGRKTLDYGVHAPGEKVWISCEVVGEGEVKIYLDEQLVKVIEKVR